MWGGFAAVFEEAENVGESDSGAITVRMLCVVSASPSDSSP